ncbi:ectoine hydroxylase-related dioxygenase (phytanoyl-CoA dioxygenase family) [Kribbella amoyensis]|uniref:Ectoine hydroxylase-related dioxygenase (Phytanoyl-CoA dioxygenase family) n=1 Tax=Kribbella amoyensis TaxID=996641 RepID=A0A561BSC4_9ACTN|nr:phytanoyl-CoA dioxygenase family protein [Kribbella amoyensis]TWD81798.1 ectoine hydroxylase-related dioxygenase (phytanoyl-CoA dioxygenase family) [Kribbella amoyensis]
MLTSNGYRLDGAPHRLGSLVPVPDDVRCDRDALRARLRRDGYLYLPGLLDPADVLAFRAYYFATTGLADEVGRPREVDRAELRRVLFSEVVPGPEYEAFCTQPALRDWFAWFFAGDTFLHRRKIIRHTAPGENGIGTATQAHYDLVYLREGTDRVLSAWIPLGDCPVSRGGLTYLENSHQRVLRDEAAGLLKRPAASITADLPGLADSYDARWLTADYAAGDVVVHTAHIVHAALDNVDPAGLMRLSTDIRYQPADQAIDARWQRHWHDRDGL